MLEKSYMDIVTNFRMSSSKPSSVYTSSYLFDDEQLYIAYENWFTDDEQVFFVGEPILFFPLSFVSFQLFKPSKTQCKYTTFFMIFQINTAKNVSLRRLYCQQVFRFIKHYHHYSLPHHLRHPPVMVKR